MSKFTLLFVLIIAFLLVLPAVAFAQDDPPADEPVVTDEPAPVVAPVEPISDPDVISRTLLIFGLFCVNALAIKEAIVKFRVKEAILKIPFVPKEATGFIIGAIALGVGWGYFLLTDLNYLGQLPYWTFASVEPSTMAFLNGLVSAVLSFLSYDLLRRYAEPKG